MNTDIDIGLKIAQLIQKHFEEILRLWSHEVRKATHGQSKNDLDGQVLQEEMSGLLEKLARHLREISSTGPISIKGSELEHTLRRITTAKARAGIMPKEPAAYVFLLKKCLVQLGRRELAGDSENLIDFVLAIQELVDEMGLLTVEFYMEVRERIINQQSLSLLELSTPVIRLWNKVLLLPLVGIIDTMRARQITESLLDAIAKTESLVTIVDITGVPVLDTSVAGHLIKTVAAAQMLGTKVIITGISPEGAQTLTKLGIDLTGIMTRGSLRSGVAEGFRMIGRRIVPDAPGGDR